MTTGVIYIRADGNLDIGYGHVMRCLALATVLKEAFKCIIIARHLTDDLTKAIEADSIEIDLIPRDISTDAESGYLATKLSRHDILVLDGYSFDASYQSSIKACGCKIVSIDDIHRSHFLSDVLINHSGGISKESYSAEPLTEFYLGPRYALIRKEFQNSERKGDRESRIMICMGGSDKDNYTALVVNMLIERNERRSVSVVIGQANPHFHQLEQLLQAHLPGSQLHRALSPQAMAGLMKSCGTAICSASTTAYEYLSVGGNLFILQTADNQQHLYDFLRNEGLAFDFDLYGHTSVDNLEKSVRKQQFVFDGKAAQRLLRIFESLVLEDQLNVRTATQEDALLLFNWANDPTVRTNAFNQKEIEWDSHQQWLAAKLNDRHCRIYIFSLGDASVGQVRLELSDSNATIDYSVDPCFRGKNIGTKILKLGMKRFQDEFRVSSISGEVLEKNISSRAVFERLNFKLISRTERNHHNTILYQRRITI